MTRRRWIADEVSGDRAFLTGEHARHLAQVLRAKVGQEFDISTGSDVRRGQIIGVDLDRVEFHLGEVVVRPVATPITVAISIFKFDRMEWAIEKCTELGVSEIIPVIAARTESYLASAAAKRVERWRKIARSAAEQSRRISPPEIAALVTLKGILSRENDSKIVLSEFETELSLKDALQQAHGPLILAFGPEGGWKQKELDAFESSEWISASLGPRILRAETAIIAAVAIASAFKV